MSGVTRLESGRSTHQPSSSNSAAAGTSRYITAVITSLNLGVRTTPVNGAIAVTSGTAGARGVAGRAGAAGSVAGGAGAAGAGGSVTSGVGTSAAGFGSGFGF